MRMNIAIETAAPGASQRGWRLSKDARPPRNDAEDGDHEDQRLEHGNELRMSDAQPCRLAALAVLQEAVGAGGHEGDQRHDRPSDEVQRAQRCPCATGGSDGALSYRAVRLTCGLRAGSEVTMIAYSSLLTSA
jgi:hypothetical protein